MLTSDPKPMQLVANSATAAYEPTKGELFSQGVSEGLNASIPGQIAEMASWFDQATPQKEWAPQDLDASPYAGKVKWEPGMTDHRASLIAAEHDRTQREEFVDSHWSGFIPFLFKTLGSLAGGMLDPVNYIPLLGEAELASLTARIGATAAHAAEGAAANALISTAGQELNAVSRSMLQEDPDLGGALMNVGIATGLGTVMGATMGRFFGRLSDNEKATGTAKALDDLGAGKPIDVGPVLNSGRTDSQALDVVRNPDAPIAAQREALTALGIDPNLTPEEIATKIGELPKAQPDFKVASPLPDTPTAPEFTTEGPLGVAPEIQQHIEQRFADLEANEGTAGIAKEALDGVKAETEGMAAKGKAMLQAALCLGRESF